MTDKQKQAIKIEEIILCQCESPEHMMLFRTIEGDDDVFVTFHLKKLPFLQRLIIGIKYIFGYTSRYGDFDELLLRPEDRCKFEKIVKYLKTNHNPIK